MAEKNKENNKKQESSTRNLRAFRWNAPAHPYREKSPYELKQAGLRLGAVVLVLVFFKQFLLAAVLIAFAFVIYVFSTVEPETVHHEVTRNGVNADGETYVWEDLSHFYFSTIYGQEVLNIETFSDRTPRLMLLLNDKVDKGNLTNFMEDFIPYRQAPKPSLLEQGSRRLSQWFVLD